GEQSPRQVLRVDGAGPEPAPPGDRRLEPARHRDRRRALGAAGGSMSLVSQARSLIARLFRRANADVELDDEVRSHIALRADDLERAGLGRAEAERRARIEFGGQL